MIAFIVIAIAAGLQSSIGFSFNILAVPILALLDPDLTPIPTMVMGIPLTAMVFLRERNRVDFKSLRWIIAGRVPGAFLGAALLASVSRRFLVGFITVIVLAAVIVIVIVIGTGYTINQTRTTKFALGLASGVTGASSAIGGPPLALLYHRNPGPVIRSSLAFLFFIGQFVSLAALGLNGELSLRPIELAFVLMPAMLIGYWASRHLTDRIEGPPLRAGVLVVSTFAGVALLLRALGAN